MATQKETNPSDELEKLKAQIAELKELLTQTQEKPKRETTSRRKKIAQDEYISVMSLVPYSLNLSTRPGGQGVVKHFENFGEVKQILYRDLVEMLENHPNFVQAGYFYIMNPDVVRQHGLDSLYETLLTKETIEELIETNTEQSLELFKSTTDGQKEIIIQLLIDKVRNSPNSVNLNVVDQISRESGINITQKANDSLLLEKVMAEEG